MANGSNNNQKQSRTVAAVDLGSNSFHMIVADLEENGSLKIIDRIKEMVRLGAGLDANNRLDEKTQKKALDCLGRFAQRLQNINKSDIRVAGTNTLRIARNADSFIKRARKKLNHRIDIISGIEEARLVYHGAVYSLAELGLKRLVVDIGGGSTEIIIGENLTPIKLESLYMGCVSVTKKFFPGGKITQSRLRQADFFSRRKIAPVRAEYLATGWEQCVGTSGSIRSISKVLLANEMTDGTITDTGLQQLLEKTLSFKSIKKIKLDGLSSDRSAVFIGGLIVLNAVFQSLNIKQMIASDGALREGLMLDMIGRIKHEDTREISVGHMAERYGVRQDHADNVIASCKHLYQEVCEAWSLNNENHQLLLLWAARLHETGLAISHYSYHNHSAYLALNSDLPGFSLQEQRLLSLLLRYHRHKLLFDDFESLSPKFRKKVFRLIIILRIAVILNRSVPTYQQPDYTVEVKKKTMTLRFPEHWFDDNPLTIADLGNEIAYLAEIDFKLKIKHLK